MTKFKIVACVLCGFGGCGTSGALWGVVSQAPRAEASNMGALELSVEPAAIEEDETGQWISYEGTIRNLSGIGASLAVAHEIVDDVGEFPVESEKPIDSSFGPDGKQEIRWSSPRGLKDGFYQFRTTVAFASKEQEETKIVVRYFAVTDRKVTVMSLDEWFERSRANLGIVIE